MKKYKAVYIGNRPLILKSLIQNIDIDLVHSFITDQSLINHKDYGGSQVTICGIEDKDLILDFLKNESYDICVTAGCPHIIPVDIMPLGRVFLNTHPSALPYGKGLHPINECFFSGHNLAGATVHYLTSKLDSGDIIDQVCFELTEDVDLDLLYSFIFTLECEVFNTSISKLVRSNLAYVGRNQVGIGTYYSRNKDDLLVDAEKIRVDDFINKVRAFSSRSLGLTVKTNNLTFTAYQAIKIKNTFILNRFSNIPTGEIIISNERFLLLRLTDGIVRINDWHVAQQEHN